MTSQPDVACDVCERRLLRGEQPDTFLAAGQPRIVCELCAPRAAHQGWKRGSAQHGVGEVPLRNGRGRTLLGRLRSARRGQEAGTPAKPEDYRELAQPFDFLTPEGVAEHGPADAVAGSGPEFSAPDPANEPLRAALDVFNASEYPRRVASLTRSLGAPEVTVRAGEAVASSIVIVLAWELCWYTYEVDLEDMQGAQARPIAQGTELSELGPEDRLANGIADERGALALL